MVIYMYLHVHCFLRDLWGSNRGQQWYGQSNRFLGSPTKNESYHCVEAISQVCMKLSQQIYHRMDKFLGAELQDRILARFEMSAKPRLLRCKADIGHMDNPSMKP